MRMFLGLALVAACPAMADEVVDTFDNGDNPNAWIWVNDLGQVSGVVQPSGGNPGGWFDSEDLFFNGHPEVIGTAPHGSPLRTALASGTLHTASIDFQRLDTSGETNCHPIYDLPSHFSIRFIDQHTVLTTPPTTIEAHTTSDESSPLQGPFPWMTASFTIPSDATDVPPGWELNAPPEIGYTWQDMMHNIDAVAFGPIDPDDITYSSCWHLGVDNITLTYGDADAVFVDGFDGPN
jgi:hypothetical protein